MFEKHCYSLGKTILNGLKFYFSFMDPLLSVFSLRTTYRYQIYSRLFTEQFSIKFYHLIIQFFFSLSNAVETDNCIFFMLSFVFESERDVYVPQVSAIILRP